jgi:antitoxin component YwqK of YwqJK toxin-antitoxin module
MKFLFCILLFSFSSFGQDSGLKIDTTYYSNDSIHEIIQTYINREGRKVKNGTYLMYDSTGVLLTEGNYLHDSIVKCVNCYEKIHNDDNTGRWKRYDTAQYTRAGVKVGTWTRYYRNGRLKSIGSYTGAITERIGSIMNQPIKNQSTGTLSSGIIDGILRVIELKEGKWEYYYENGELRLEEEYIDEILVNTVSWPRSDE